MNHHRFSSCTWTGIAVAAIPVVAAILLLLFAMDVGFLLETVPLLVGLLAVVLLILFAAGYGLCRVFQRLRRRYSA
jgi:chromate transport protein ChrA